MIRYDNVLRALRKDRDEAEGQLRMHIAQVESAQLQAKNAHAIFNEFDAAIASLEALQGPELQPAE